MRAKVQKAIERAEWARRWLAPFKSHDALIWASSAAPDSPREVCAVHGWAPHVPPGTPLPPPSQCPLCIEEAAHKPKGPDVYLIGPGNGVPVAKDSRLDALWKEWQKTHPDNPGGPRPGSFEEQAALQRIDVLREDREDGIDRGGRLVYQSPTDPSRVHYARRRRRPGGSVRLKHVADVSDNYW